MGLTLARSTSDSTVFQYRGAHPNFQAFLEHSLQSVGRPVPWYLSWTVACELPAHGLLSVTFIPLEQKTTRSISPGRSFHRFFFVKRWLLVCTSSLPARPFFKNSGRRILRTDLKVTPQYETSSIDRDTSTLFDIVMLTAQSPTNSARSRDAKKGKRERGALRRNVTSVERTHIEWFVLSKVPEGHAIW